jgi:hypothetical protein
MTVVYSLRVETSEFDRFGVALDQEIWRCYLGPP